ncbi:MAG: Nitroreductase [Parcubacteria group bacterium GW2011_GWD2_38_12]|nr:MAG: Nitroreductase [Parcubacteria group bacterium GW2011_GWC2_36_17]KKQ52883.1 MAG: Nitroreductase [Parcubacteria group bacterium GW2011_GWD2_38_12]KKQ59086.1 MAG: Nitroreductase [Parcubacteria group bacterium GW2011_GWC1_38_17]KKQ59701.1 MAG: Nitroreductase [Parcubacteria group bacterium GW2011_GWD1_38_16]
MNKEIINKILEVAVNAPSGENSQPWRFEVNSNKIHIFNLPERDRSLYNFGQKGSLVAHGALIENILITAPIFGYNAEIDLLPDNKDFDFIATISLVELLPDQQKNESLYSCIVKRVTNRKPYKNIPLSDEQLKDLKNVENEIGEGRVIFVYDPEKMKDIANLCSVNERVMFENKLIHNFFFDHINWTEKEELEKRLGFYIKTLELPSPVQFALKLFRYWPAMNLFNKLGLNKIIAKGNAVNYANASAMVAFAVKNNTSRDFIIAGRLMQRLWLKVTKMGLSAQPMAGMLFFMQAISGGETSKFSSSQIELIKNAHENVKKTFDINNEMPVMIFRVGYGGEPSARSSKKPPEIIFKN